MSTPDRYAAFISYRHVEPDRSVTGWLQRELETYRVPAPLVAAGVPPRPGRVFRDEEELAASADLSGEIQAALERADALVVICSPRVPESRWVNAEIERYASLGRARRIFPVLVEGEPAQSFPPALLALGHEPLAADLRELPGGEGRRGLRRTARLKLLAGLLGVEYDALRRRDEERRRRRLALAAVTGAVLAAVFAALAVTAALQWQRAERELTVSRAQTLAARAEAALAEAMRADLAGPDAECATCPDPQRAALLALESLAIHPTLTADAVLRRALWRVAPLPPVETPESGVATAADDAGVLARTADGRFVLRRSEEGVAGWVFETAVLTEAATGRRVALLAHEWPIQRAFFSADGRWLATVTGHASADAAEPGATALVGSTVRVWATTDAREVTELSLAAEDGIARAEPDARGEWLLTTGAVPDDSGRYAARRWPVAPDTLRREACTRLTRNLSPSEWATFVGEGPPRATCPGLPVVSE